MPPCEQIRSEHTPQKRKSRLSKCPYYNFFLQKIKNSRKVTGTHLRSNGAVSMAIYVCCFVLPWQSTYLPGIIYDVHIE